MTTKGSLIDAPHGQRPDRVRFASLQSERAAVDDVIHAAGAPAILQDCRRRFPDGLATGDVGWTTAGVTPTQWVTHVVDPNHNRSERDLSLLTSCYERARQLTDQLGARTVAFPESAPGATAGQSRTRSTPLWKYVDRPRVASRRQGWLPSAPRRMPRSKKQFARMTEPMPTETVPVRRAAFAARASDVLAKQVSPNFERLPARRGWTTLAVWYERVDELLAVVGEQEDSAIDLVLAQGCSMRADAF